MAYQYKDTDLVSEVEKIERYCPVMEDISLDDRTLCTAVEGIENQYVLECLFEYSCILMCRFCDCLFDVRIFIHFRISQMETIQYFQFDQTGNMFVYPASCGCTGIPKLAKPGDDIFFSDSGEEIITNTMGSDESFVTETQYSTVQVMACVSSAPNTFLQPLDSVKLEKLSHKNFSPEN